MGEDAGRGLECQKTMDGKVSNRNGSEKAIPSCCLKARASDPEADAISHSTVVSGWFSESRSRTDKASRKTYFNNPMWPGGKLVYQTTKKGKRTQVSCYWQEYSRGLILLISIMLI